MQCIEKVKGVLRFSVIAVLLFLAPAARAGDILVEETGLHDNAIVRGIDLTFGMFPLFNSDNVTVFASGETDPSLFSNVRLTAYGISYVNKVINNGDFSVTVQGGNTSSGDLADASAYGIYASFEVNNFGNIIVQGTGGRADSDGGASSYGIRSYFNVTNNGNIEVTASGGRAGFDASSVAKGIHNDGWVANSGDITVRARGGSGFSGVADNAYAYAHGIDSIGIVGDNGPVGGVDNSGDITVETIGGDASDRAFSYASGIITSYTVNNSGNITVSVKGGRADFADASGTGVISFEGDVNNTGNIQVTATGGSAQTSRPSNVSSSAIGIETFSGSRVVNYGKITVIASAKDGFDANAYGIYFDYNRSPQFFPRSGFLTNTGIISTTADTAYEVYVASGDITLVDTYNLTLDGDPAKASFFVGDVATLSLNNAALTLTDIAGETRWDTEYRLFETEGRGSVVGAFGSVQQPLNPNATALYNDRGTADRADDTVALAYTPTSSAALGSISTLQQATSSAVTIANNHVAGLIMQWSQASAPQPVRVAAAETVVSDVGGRLFSAPPTSSVYFEPYYSWLDSDTSPVGYDGDIAGFVTGYDRWFGSNLVGFHLGYGHAGIDFSGAGFDANSEDQDVFTLGIDAAGRWDDWTLRFSSTAFHGSHDYDGLSGALLNKKEAADYDSYGFYNSLMTGHLFRFGRQALLPEVGLNHIWTHRESYTSTVEGDPSWNTRFASLDDHEVQAEAKLRWLGDFTVVEQSLMPSVAVGVKQFLTDAETSVHQSVGGSAPVQVETDQDETALTVSASLALVQKNRLNVTLAYDGEYTSDTRLDTVWLRLRKPF